MGFLKREKSKTGLVLGSGAARGLAHIGVLKALKEQNISIDMIAGSSMGALVGACYARHGKIIDIEEIALRMDWKQLAQLADPNLALFFKGVIHGKKVKDLLKTLIGDVNFRDLKIPLAVVATDVNTGEEIVIKTGSVIDAVRASISVPAIFMPVKLRDRFLIDGGIVNPVPVTVVKNMGATFIIACNVTYKPQRRKLLRSAKGQKSPVPIPKAQIKNAALVTLNNKIDKLFQNNKDKIQSFQRLTDSFKKKIYKGKQRIDPNTPSIFDTILKAIYAMEYEIAKSKMKEADVIITPDTGHIAALEFYRAKEAIAEGYKAAKDTLSEKGPSF
ncbi:MAG: patatin-like phospholipase family protein [Candidatus Aureabacteria bacterium]|nr:patatin-like phospholipase family protein [Candidatus Auribacterota bacterium]MCK5161876.1 patatin-like phospholipase family protein [Candidatus Auribacterota bacterium]